MNERESHFFSQWIISKLGLRSLKPHPHHIPLFFPAYTLHGHPFPCISDVLPGKFVDFLMKSLAQTLHNLSLVSLFVCQESQWGLINKVGERDWGLGEGSEGLTAGTLETKHQDYNLDSTYHLQTEHPREVTWSPLSPFLICRLVTVVCISQGWGIERVRSYVKPGSWDGFAAFSMAFAKEIFSTYIIY